MRECPKINFGNFIYNMILRAAVTVKHFGMERDGFLAISAKI